jgi:hypothetical protein
MMHPTFAAALIRERTKQRQRPSGPKRRPGESRPPRIETSSAQASLHTPTRRRSLRRLLIRTYDAALRVCDDFRYAGRRALELRGITDQADPLRWRRNKSGTYELVGSHLPRHNLRLPAKVSPEGRSALDEPDA